LFAFFHFQKNIPMFIFTSFTMFTMASPWFSNAIFSMPQRSQGVKGLKSATLNRLQWQWHCYPWTSTDVALARTPLVFVDHVAELFGALLAAEGPSLVCSATEVPKLLRCLKQHQAGVVNNTYREI
jgi:hypothetical protein